MEKKKLIEAHSPEGDVVNMIANYLREYGQFNLHKITSMYYEALRNNSSNQLLEVEQELVSQVLEHLRTYAIWEKWGE